MENINAKKGRELERILRSSSLDAIPDSIFISNLQSKLMDEKNKMNPSFLRKYRFHIASIAVLCIVLGSIAFLGTRQLSTSTQDNIADPQNDSAVSFPIDNSKQDQLNRDRDTNGDGLFTIEDLGPQGDPDLDFNTIDPRVFYINQKPEVDIKANGSDGAVFTTADQALSIVFTSNYNVSSCDFKYRVIYDNGSTFETGWGGGSGHGSVNYSANELSTGLYRFSIICLGNNLVDQAADAVEVHIQKVSAPETSAGEPKMSLQFNGMQTVYITLSSNTPYNIALQSENVKGCELFKSYMDSNGNAVNQALMSGFTHLTGYFNIQDTLEPGLYQYSATCEKFDGTLIGELLEVNIE
jgi:hypothetical protein